MVWKIGWLAMLLTSFSIAAKKVESQMVLSGLPLQIGWADVNDDGKLDLQALMLISQTTGEVDTYFEDGNLRGLYEDETHKEKYFVTYLQTDDGWQEVAKLELGEVNTLGFIVEPTSPARLNIWTQEGLTRYRWKTTEWEPFAHGRTPGLMASAPTSLSQFPFWQETPSGPFWIVPDLAGIHILQPNKDFAQHFIDYPAFTIDSNYASGEYHTRSLQLPRILNLDGQPGPELVFVGGKQATSYRIHEDRPMAHGHLDGTLIDLDGDGLADKLVVKENDDIDGLKELARVTSKVTSYRATGPLTFENEPIGEQDLAGFLIQDNDSDIQLAPPFSDINNDGRVDLTGIAIKLSVWQIAKLVAIGRLKIKFLLHLHVQEDNGQFRTLGNGPYVMEWKLNIRKLKLPEFAQIAADYDGDGWTDILKVGDSKLEITPVNAKGFQKQAVRTLKIPRAFRKSDQAFGRDLDANGRAEVVLIKLKSNQTIVGVLEVNP